MTRIPLRLQERLKRVLYLQQLEEFNLSVINKIRDQVLDLADEYVEDHYSTDYFRIERKKGKLVIYKKSNAIRELRYDLSKAKDVVQFVEVLGEEGLDGNLGVSNKNEKGSKDNRGRKKRS